MPKINKFWKFVNLNEDEVELQLYSDIASKQSQDWWTGEKGDEITPKLFKAELDAITGNNICVRINSNGGDVFAANVIATALEEASNKGKNVTCKIDGICASAAVRVALACSKISIANGAYIMIHKPMNVLFGYYNADEMRNLAETLDIIQSGIVDCYVTRTGLSEKECTKLMDKETCFTAKEAVEKGFADEILFSTPENEEDEDNSSVMNNICTAFAATAYRYESAPKALQEAFENKKLLEEGKKPMEIKNYNDLKAAYPELLSNAENKAREDGAEAERKRIQEIDNLAGKINNALLNSAKYGETKMSADEVIVKAFKEDKMLGNGYLNAAKEDAEENDKVQASAVEEDGKTKDEQDEEEMKNFLVTTAKNIRNGGKK